MVKRGLRSRKKAYYKTNTACKEYTEISELALI